MAVECFLQVWLLAGPVGALHACILEQNALAACRHTCSCHIIVQWVLLCSPAAHMLPAPPAHCALLCLLCATWRPRRRSCGCVVCPAWT